MTNQLMRGEYPRPQFVREKWASLNGEWEFAFDDDGIGSGKPGMSREKGGSAGKSRFPSVFKAG